MNWLLNQEAIVRLGCFITVLMTMFIWEQLAPRRQRTASYKQRLLTNLSLVAVNTLLVRCLPGLAAGLLALRVDEHAIGLLYMLNLPFCLHILLAFVLLDLAIYTQHLVFHKVAWCWRLHRVHHTDEAFDVSTGVRFHPVEIVLSMLIKMAVVYCIGAPFIAVVIFEVILNASSLFNHGNVKLAATVDRVLRLFIVTPDMHRVHHSVLKKETDSNFGFNFSFWDKLFGTYRAQPEAGHEQMQIGLVEFKGKETTNILSLLRQPFRKI